MHRCFDREYVLVSPVDDAINSVASVIITAHDEYAVQELMVACRAAVSVFTDNLYSQAGFAGAGCTEMHIIHHLRSLNADPLLSKCPSITDSEARRCVSTVCDCFTDIVRALLGRENSHARIDELDEANKTGLYGWDLTEQCVIDVSSCRVVDGQEAKLGAIRSATQAALMLLRTHMLIMDVQ